MIQTTIQTQKRVFINPAKQNRMNVQEIKQYQTQNNVLHSKKAQEKLQLAHENTYLRVLPSETLKRGGEEREKEISDFLGFKASHKNYLIFSQIYPFTFF